MTETEKLNKGMYNKLTISQFEQDRRDEFEQKQRDEYSYKEDHMGISQDVFEGMQ